MLEEADDDAWRRSFRAAALSKEIAKIKELARQPEAFSQPPSVQFWLAITLRETGGFKEAEALLRQGQQQHPADFWLNYQLGITLLWGDRNYIPYLVADHPSEEAVGFFRAAVALRSTSAAAHNYLGVALQLKRDLNGAMAEWRRAIALDAKFAAAHCNLGLALRAQGDLSGALDAYRQAIAVDPHYALAHNNLADLLANGPDPKLGDAELAVAHAKKATELAPTLWMTWNTLGEASYRAGQWKEAIAALEMGLPLHNGGDSEDFFFLAMAHERAGNKVEARKRYQQGVDWMDKHAPKNADLLRFRAEAASLLGVK